MNATQLNPLDDQILYLLIETKPNSNLKTPKSGTRQSSSSFKSKLKFSQSNFQCNLIRWILKNRTWNSCPKSKRKRSPEMRLRKAKTSSTSLAMLTEQSKTTSLRRLKAGHQINRTWSKSSSQGTSLQTQFFRTEKQILTLLMMKALRAPLLKIKARRKWSKCSGLESSKSIQSFSSWWISFRTKSFRILRRYLIFRKSMMIQNRSYLRVLTTQSTCRT